MEITIRICPVDTTNPFWRAPKRATPGASGFDVCSAERPFTIDPSERRLVSLGFCIEIPKGFEIQVRPRSGLANKHGVTVLNAPGTIDSDYRGECKVLLINLGGEPVDINPGDRIAQFVLESTTPAQFVQVEKLSPTERGAGGFGSTGRN